MDDNVIVLTCGFESNFPSEEKKCDECGAKIYASLTGIKQVNEILNQSDGKITVIRFLCFFCSIVSAKLDEAAKFSPPSQEMQDELSKALGEKFSLDKIKRILTEKLNIPEYKISKDFKDEEK